MRSFRFQLALRAAAAMAVGMTAVGAVTFLGLRSILDSELDASILNVASIQAASLTDAPGGEMHFHEWELTPEEAASLEDLIRYAQVWQADGVSLLRSQYMTSDLPLDREHLARAEEGNVIWTQTSWNGMPIRALYYPLERFGMAHERHVLEVAAPLVKRNEMLLRVGLFLGALTLVMSGATFAGASWLAGRAMRPVHEVIDQAEVIRAGSFDAASTPTPRCGSTGAWWTCSTGCWGGSRGRSRRSGASRRTRATSCARRSPRCVGNSSWRFAVSVSPRSIGSCWRARSRRWCACHGSRRTLLVLARSDSGALRPRLEEVVVAEVAGRVVERLQGQAGEKDLEVAVTDEGGATARVDPGLVGQAVWNLVDNAIKYAPGGGRVDVRVARQGSDVVITVEDSGPGFQDPAEAFRRFFREDAARTHGTSTDGTGLGLAIVRAVAEAHGGRASAENRPGGGARVAVRLPAGAAGVAPAAPAAFRPAARGC